MSGLVRSRDRRVERAHRPEPPAPAEQVVEGLCTGLGWVLGTLVGAGLALLAVAWQFARTFPRSTVVMVSCGAAFVAAGPAGLVLAGLVWLGLGFCLLSQLPEQLRSAVSRVPGAPAPGGSGTAGSRRVREEFRAGGPRPAQAPGEVRRRLHRIGRDPVSGRDVYTPTFEVDPGRWPDAIDIDEQIERTR